jgi:hypothetical protein
VTLATIQRCSGRGKQGSGWALRHNRCTRVAASSASLGGDPHSCRPIDHRAMRVERWPVDRLVACTDGQRGPRRRPAGARTPRRRVDDPLSCRGPYELAEHVNNLSISPYYIPGAPKSTLPPPPMKSSGCAPTPPAAFQASRRRSTRRRLTRSIHIISPTIPATIASPTTEIRIAVTKHPPTCADTVKPTPVWPRRIAIGPPPRRMTGRLLDETRGLAARFQSPAGLAFKSSCPGPRFVPGSVLSGERWCLGIHPGPADSVLLYHKCMTNHVGAQDVPEESAQRPRT